MNVLTLQPLRGTVPQPPHQKTLRLVALHDGAPDAHRIHNALVRVASAMRPPAPVESFRWSFDMLSRLDIRHASLHHAAETDVVMVAATGPVPLQVVSWIEDCLRENVGNPPLLSVCNDQITRPTVPLTETHRDLNSIARRWGTAVLTVEELEDRVRRGLLPGPPHEPQFHSRFDPDDMLATPLQRGWGIND